ncbi:hypothetical protein FQA47_013682 [Oryzias melastigma]|uniref:Uncharacterized protein n=1 Tax=Oryzias melastigma TaxID=30732 RepID=A0A834F352_ORYME|nr:hypothetical protein FQA47_013682 [Oryzias melastigma]
MTGVARWNFQRLVELKLSAVRLPAVFDPALIVDLSSASERAMEDAAPSPLPLLSGVGPSTLACSHEGGH